MKWSYFVAKKVDSNDSYHCIIIEKSYLNKSISETWETNDVIKG